ncbi:MAG: methyltransferase [Pseudopedobacter saltans]|uniref:tRNA1(Val) (adenine(37)-N6)-methyltransferase n=1 Tax=Pseudopedobacter saltans TaxID=151895 RepID=A0A2W5H095_9SPHI|nr:MAG: methyltransferase [Pseudopedobacter saltans]
MGNSYFQFKQFTIHQDKTAMKVCTDACLFGAYLSKNIPAKRVLDIGAGTGLLDLMYVQNNVSSHITAIEIEENAYLQAKDNIEKSEWKDTITVQNVALQAFEPDTKFELIFSNPPFFDNDLKSIKAARNMAMHSTQLSLKEIFSFSEKYLENEGKLALLLPFHRTKEAEKIALEHSFFLFDKVLVKQTIQHDFFRSILIFSNTKNETKESEITIRNKDNQYANSFAELLKDFYLYL